MRRSKSFVFIYVMRRYSRRFWPVIAYSRAEWSIAAPLCSAHIFPLPRETCYKYSNYETLFLLLMSGKSDFVDSPVSCEIYLKIQVSNVPSGHPPKCWSLRYFPPSTSRLCIVIPRSLEVSHRLGPRGHRQARRVNQVRGFQRILIPSESDKTYWLVKYLL